MNNKYRFYPALREIKTREVFYISLSRQLVQDAARGVSFDSSESANGFTDSFLLDNPSFRSTHTKALISSPVPAENVPGGLFPQSVSNRVEATTLFRRV